MRILELYVDAFGSLRDAEVRNIKRGVNVLYGANEFGKTTLLEFIRGVLFGFQNRKVAGQIPYLPLTGESRAGLLVCEMNNGDIIRIRRTQGVNDGSVTLTDESDTFGGQERLKDLLGHASAELFHNIFAFSLDELQALRSLQGEEIKNRIYGAGLGLGPSALSGIEKTLQTRRDALFKVRSKKNKLAEELEKISRLEQSILETQKDLSCYDELETRNRTLENEIEELGKTLAKFDDKRRQTELLADLYPIYLEWQKAESELKASSPCVNLPDHAAETLNRMREETDNLSHRIEEEKDSSLKLRLEMDNLSVNAELLSREKEVSKLRNMTEQVRSTLQDRVAIEEKRERLDYEIQSDIQNSGLGWDEKFLLEFSISDPEREEIQTHREMLDLKRQETARARERLEERRDETTKKRSEIFRPPKWLKNGAYALLGLGATGTVVGSIWFNLAVLIISTIVLLLGGTGFRMILKSRFDLGRPDELEPVLIKRIKELENESEQVYQKWRKWLKERHFDVLLSPVQTEKAISSIKEIQNRVLRRDELDQRLEDMAEPIAKAETLTNSLLLVLGQTAGDYLPGDIENLCSTFDTTVRRYEKATAMEGQFMSLREKIDNLTKQFMNKQKKLEDFIQSAGAKTTEEFLELCRQSQHIREQKKIRNEKRSFIQSKTNLEKNFDELIHTLEATVPEQIQSDLDTIIRDIKKTQTERDAMNLEMGEIRNRIRLLGSDEKLSQLQLDIEIKKTELNRLAREWAVVEIAEHLLNKTKRKYEQERQPAVLRSAEASFSSITDHRYSKIYFSLDSNEIHITNNSNEIKTPSQMSRGTREQLYLALRLGLIEQYETRSESLPIVMDDVLVNFDDDRSQRVMEILNHFAENRQVIVLSCHHQTLKTYKKFGAHSIDLIKK